MRILVTGVLGFIGSHFAKQAMHAGHTVIGFARDTDQWAIKRIENIKNNPKFHLVYGDITKEVSDTMTGVDVVVNFAAKTFVDHSILDPHPFVRSNILGTYNLLNQAVKCKPRLFIQISTDEVYGTIENGYAKETDTLNPTNPYSASKAAGDLLALSYFHTYGLPIIITRTENNYGPYQASQKAIPTFVKKALNDEPLPVYGDGKHRRMWLHVEDHCDAILYLMEHGVPGEIYNIGARQEKENIELAKDILRMTGKPESMINFVPDHNIRPGHDRRYGIDVEKITELGWQPKKTYEAGLAETITWYTENRWWLQ